MCVVFLNSCRGCIAFMDGVGVLLGVVAGMKMDFWDTILSILRHGRRQNWCC